MSILLPFTLRGEHICLDARINGVPATLILDTGSAMCTLDDEWARALRLRSQETKRQAIGTGSAPMSLATMDSLLLSEMVELRDEPAALVPLQELSAQHGHHIHGTIGSGFFMRYIVEIDHVSRVLRLHDPAMFAYDGPGERIPIDLARRVPVLRADLVANGTTIPARLVLDLGTAGYACALTKPFVDQYLESLTTGPCTERLLGGGVGGPIYGRVTTISELRLGKLRVPNPTVAMPADAQGFFGLTRVDGTLGAPVLSRTRLILDYAHQEVIVEPLTAMDVPFVIDRSGLAVHAAGPNLDTVVIVEVAAGSPAARAGIAVGDILRSVNGRPVSGESIVADLEVFTQAGATLELRVERSVPLVLP